ncbi:MAG: hypothetical protein AAB489_05840 [Patescibacteria group bacterium]
MREKYQRMCYKDHTKVLIHSGLRDSEVADRCRTLLEFQAECFEGLGRDISNSFREGDRKRASAACEKFSGAFAPSCIAGHAYALVDNAGDGSIAFRFCDSLQEEKNRQDCFRMSGKYLATLHEIPRSDLLSTCRATTDNSALCEREAKRATAGLVGQLFFAVLDLLGK